MKSVDLNADIGEGFPFDAELMVIVSSVNVGCGAHAGNEMDSVRTAIQASNLGLGIGLHVGYPDRDGFGRLSMDAASPRVLRSLHQQVRLFEADYVKPHGAFYHDSSKPGPAADALADLLAESGLSLLGLAGTEHERIARSQDVRFISEGFADRRTDDSGGLIPRTEPGAVIDDPVEAVENALKLASVVDSICLHGDNIHAVEFATRVRAALEKAGFVVRRCH